MIQRIEIKTTIMMMTMIGAGFHVTCCDDALDCDDME